MTTKILDILLSDSSINAIHKWNNYFDIYDEVFAPIRESTKTILEIGCAGGGSAQLLKKYFQNATIYTIDIRHLAKNLGEGIHQITGNATDINLLQILPEFDLIMDDGSHNPYEQIQSFEYLFKNKLRNGGVYLVEDLEHSFYNWWKKMDNDKNFFDYTHQRVLDMQGFITNTVNYYTENLYKVINYQQISVFYKKTQVLNYTSLYKKE
jgi:trans-aconitate methyltransferase